jgi:MinD-like ATPase involved in chromosome partitioning or flagellar assembly
VSEQDWQATVLAELGIPLSGLMVTDARPATRTDPTGRPSPARAAAPPPRPPVEPRQSVEQRPAFESPQPAPTRADRVVAEEHSGSSWTEQPSQEGQPEPPGFPALGEPLDQLPPDAWEQASQAWDQAAQSLWNQAPQAPQSAPEPEEQQEEWEGGSASAWQHEPEQSQPRPQRGRRQPDPEASRSPGPPGPRPPAGPPGQRPAAGPSGGPIAAHDLVRKAAHGDPFARRLSRGMRRVVGASGAGEVRRTADVEMTLGRQLPSRRQIAVTSIRGGAGKTTVAALTATVIAEYRQDRVLAVDADSGLGSLPLRLGVAPQRSVHDLAAAQPRTFEDVTHFLGRTVDGLWVLSGTAGGRIGGELDLATYQAAVGALSRYFAAVVVDCGAGLLPELQRGVLADSHSQVMVTPGTVDGAISAQGALDWQARNGFEHLLPRTVIAFVTHTPHVDADLSRAAQMLGGMPVVHLPYDRHLATGTAVESARIGEDTRAAAIRVAVEAFARAVSV